MHLNDAIERLVADYEFVVAPPRAIELDSIEPTVSGEIFLILDPDRPDRLCWLVCSGVWSPGEPPTSRLILDFDPASRELRGYSLHSCSRSHWVSTEQFPADETTTVEGLLSRLSEFRLAIERDRVTSPDDASAAFQSSWNVQAGSEQDGDYE